MKAERERIKHAAVRRLAEDIWSYNKFGRCGSNALPKVGRAAQTAKCGPSLVLFHLPRRLDSAGLWPVIPEIIILHSAQEFGLGNTRAPACRGRRPRRPHLCICSFLAGRAEAVGEGADCDTRGRVCSPEPIGTDGRSTLWKHKWGVSRPKNAVLQINTIPFSRAS